jgi:hypothetical protein
MRLPYDLLLIFDMQMGYDIIKNSNCSPYMGKILATLAQSAEQLIRNEQVVGSIPTGGSFYFR